MRKYIALAILSMFCLNVGAATFSTNIATTAVLSIPTITGGAATLNTFILTSSATDAGSCGVYDTTGTGLRRTNSAYSSITSYATNYYTVWTNFYGVVNYSGTNVCLAQVTNTVAAATNTLSPVLSLFTGTNSTTEYTSLNTYFGRGIVVTNTSSGTITITIGYSQ